MSGLAKQVENLTRLNQEIARDGVQAVDWFASERSPAALDAVQNEIRGGLYHVEDRLQASARRANTWKRLRNTRWKAYRSLLRARAERRDLINQRDQLLTWQREMLRQFGDACAWIVLGGNSRLLRLLHSSERTHHLAQLGIGRIGPAALSSAGHATGQFFVVENDLTRVLGIGDLTIVPHGRPWSSPLALEVKTHGEFELGAEAHIEGLAHVSSLPLDAELLHGFTTAVGLSHSDVPGIPANAIQQVEEMEERSRWIFQLVTESVERIPQVHQERWTALTRLLQQAQSAGSAFHLMETGVVGLACRVGADADALVEMRRLIERVRSLGLVPKAQSYAAATSEDVRTNAGLAAFVPPIPLWEIPSNLRSSLMVGELFYACVYDPELWVKSMAEMGLQFRSEDHWWYVQFGDSTHRIDPLEVSKLTLSAALGLVSPRGVTSAIRDACRALET